MATFTDTIAETIDISPFGGGPTSDNIEYPAWGGDLADTVLIDQPDNFYYVFSTRIVEEMVSFVETQAIRWTAYPVLTDRFGASLAFLQLYKSVHMTDGATLQEAFDAYKYAVRKIRDRAKFGDATSINSVFSTAFVQALRIGDPSLIPYYNLALADSMTVEDAARLQEYLELVDRLGLADALIMPGKVRVTVVQALTVLDNLARFLGASLAEVLAVVEAVARKERVLPSLSEGVTMADAVGRGLLLRVVANDDVKITAEEVLRQVFKPTIAEGFEVVSLFLDQGALTTWVVNLSHGGVTEYTNYKFNSFAKMGSQYIAAGDDGLYQLDGDDDAGEDIISRMKSGMLQVGKSNYSSFRGIYLGLRGGGDFLLKLVTGDGKTFVYSVEARSMETTRVNVGKGLRARYFSYELISTGQDFDLDSIEFIPIVAGRRV